MPTSSHCRHRPDHPVLRTFLAQREIVRGGAERRFCGRAPLGTDLGQLILGEVQTGQRPAADLPDLEAACLPAYVAGVHAEGGTADLTQVRRTHATLMTVFSALPSVPIEHLNDEPTPQLRRLFHGRAGIARFALDLLDDTTTAVRPAIRT